MAACPLVAGKPIPELFVAAPTLFDVADRPAAGLAVARVVSGVAGIAAAILGTAGVSSVSPLTAAKGSVMAAAAIKV